jgi:hypothetical protein
MLVLFFIHRTNCFYWSQKAMNITPTALPLVPPPLDTTLRCLHLFFVVCCVALATVINQRPPKAASYFFCVFVDLSSCVTPNDKNTLPQYARPPHTSSLRPLLTWPSTVGWRLSVCGLRAAIEGQGPTHLFQCSCIRWPKQMIQPWQESA